MQLLPLDCSGSHYPCRISYIYICVLKCEVRVRPMIAIKDYFQPVRCHPHRRSKRPWASGTGKVRRGQFDPFQSTTPSPEIKRGSLHCYRWSGKLPLAIYLWLKSPSSVSNEILLQSVQGCSRPLERESDLRMVLQSRKKKTYSLSPPSTAYALPPGACCWLTESPSTPGSSCSVLQAQRL